jgi:DNA-binding response OmpR family regulator
MVRNRAATGANVQDLRARTEAGGAFRLIQTVRGVGDVLRAG